MISSIVSRPLHTTREGIHQDKTPHQAYDQMAVVGIFTLHLTGAGCQQMLQGPKTVLYPVAPLPCPYQPWPADVGCQTEQVVQRHTRLMDDDEGHGPIRGTGGPQPHITHARHVRALTPRPLAGLLQVTPLDLAPI